MRRRLFRLAGNLLQGGLASLVAAFVLAPVVWLVISSLSSPRDLTSVPPRWLPSPLYLEHYRELILGSGSGETLTAVTLQAFRFSLRNSLLVATSVTVACLVFGTMAAYAFARLHLPMGSRLIYVLLLVQMLPVVVLLVPLYLTVSRLNLTDRLETVIILLSAVHLPFVIWILRGYFQGIPAELEEAALVDGANRLQALILILLPLALPGLFAAGIYAFIQSWNAFMIPLIFTSSDTLRTATVAIAMFVGRHYTEYGLMSAAGVLASLPPALLAIFFQRYLLAGLTAGAVKG